MKITNVEVLVLKSPGLVQPARRLRRAARPHVHGPGARFDRCGHHRLFGHGDIGSGRKGRRRSALLERAREWNASKDSRRSLWAKTRWSPSGSGTRCTAAASITDAAASPFRRFPPSISRFGTSWASSTVSPCACCLERKWRDRVRAYASTLFRPTPEAMREATRRYLDQGFTAIKFGWGVFGEDASQDVRLVEAARTEMGDTHRPAHRYRMVR